MTTLKGLLTINNKDAYTTWGITPDTSTLSALMTPPALKTFVSNTSRLAHGKEVIAKNPRLDARDVSLTLNLTANTETQFFKRYASFCEELATGVLNIKTSFQPDVVYKFNYVSCSQFTQFMRGIAKLSLKLNEPNPNDRTE